jgi:hypothetical protein
MTIIVVSRALGRIRSFSASHERFATVLMRLWFLRARDSGQRHNHLICSFFNTLLVLNLNLKASAQPPNMPAVSVGIEIAEDTSTSKRAKTHTCQWDNCDRAFFYSRDLNDHVRSAHTFERPFRCLQVVQKGADQDWIVSNIM